MNRIAYLAALLALATTAGPAPAAFIVTVGNATIDAGSMNGYIDVTIAADDDTPLQAFGLQLQVTRAAASSSLPLILTDTQYDQPNYVFYMNTAGAPSGSLSQVGGWANDSYAGGDGSLDGSSVAIGADTYLLVRIGLDATGAVAGETYSVGLINSNRTFFIDDNFDPVFYTAQSGTITIQAASGAGPPNPSAVPAPAGAVLMLTGAAGFGVLGLVRRRRGVAPAA